MATSLTTLPIVARMPASQTLADLLPLRSADHRFIVSADDVTVAEIFSGSIGISAANELQVRIVTAVNSHDLFVAAVAEFMGALGELDEPSDRMNAAAGLMIDALIAAGAP
ncbi:hypothetical protein ACQ4WP_26820 [Janthinobacterium sp. GB4P2]|uniref:hypothetical protein n=1 Tax=Janthinobacterium sp. GB4P2 TaxID=3424189 RepID=UPI003F24C2A0